EYDLDELPEHFGLELAHELFEQSPISRHRLSANDIGSCNVGTFLGLQILALVRALSSQPECQCRNLASTQVDINTVQVVTNNEFRHSFPKLVQIRKLLSNAFAGQLRRDLLLIRPTLFVNRFQQIERI